MPKPTRQPGQAFLFEETTDDVAAKTYRTEDEKEFVKERRRKTIKATGQPTPETGSCCDRCLHYQHAIGCDAFGLCRKLGMTTSSHLPELDKNTVVDMDDAWTRYRVTADPLRCKPWAGQGCSGYVKTEEQAA